MNTGEMYGDPPKTGTILISTKWSTKKKKKTMTTKYEWTAINQSYIDKPRGHPSATNS